MNKKNLEIRSFAITRDEGSRLISGYAVVFNSRSHVMFDEKRGLYYTEVILPEAITDELLQRSDVVMNYAHDDNNILARSRNGEGTLKLSVDDRGLFFQFEMPNSALGEQVLESINRGDISECSFAFTLGNDCETWTQDEDGAVIRTINKISGLYDCAIVTHAAYPETEVSARSLKKLIELYNMKEEDIKLREEELDKEEEKEEEKPQDEQEDNKDKERSEEEEKPQEEEKADEEEEEKPQDEPEDKKKDEEDTEEKKRNKKMNKDTRNIHKRSITMEKRFSLLNAIRNIAQGKALDAAEQAVVNRGRQIMTGAGGIDFNGQIQLPVAEMRDDDPVHYTVEADGEHVVVTDYLNILEPLKAKNVLVKAGATYLTGLKGNVQLPVASDVNAYWEGEITSAKNGAGSFSHINMTPHRIAVEVPISKQFIIQDTLGAENLIRKLIVEKINDKLEATILSANAKDGLVPAGIFNGVTAEKVSDFSDICDLEATLEDNNFAGEFKYIVNPKAKSALRSMIKGTNATGMVWENDEIDGTPADWTTNMNNYTLAYGNWSDLYIGQWGALDLTVDPYTLAGDGQIRIIAQAWFDYKVVRDGAIVLGEVSHS